MGWVTMKLAVNSFRIRRSAALHWVGLYSRLLWVPPTLRDEILNSEILDEWTRGRGCGHFGSAQTAPLNETKWGCDQSLADQTWNIIEEEKSLADQTWNIIEEEKSSADQTWNIIESQSGFVDSGSTLCIFHLHICWSELCVRRFTENHCLSLDLQLIF